jgi:hypothetical protein
VRIGYLGITVLLVVAGCSGSPRTGPTEVRNDSDRSGVVRLVGATGSVDLAVPPHTVVVVEAPPAIGKVASAWLTVDDCLFKGGGTIYGDDTNGRASFDTGGLLWFDDHSSGGTSGWAGSPPPAPAAATTTICATAPTPGVH